MCKCNSIHKSIVEQFRIAIVYGKSVRHQPQRVGLTHELADEDISQLFHFLRSAVAASARKVSETNASVVTIIKR